MTAEESFKRYPYYIYPAIEGLADAEGEERKALLRRVAAGVGPMSALRTLLGVDPEEFRDFYGEAEHPELSTEATIARFVDKFGGDNSSSEQEEQAEIPVAPPAIDYAAMMLDSQEETGEMPEDTTSDLLNSFFAGPSGQDEDGKETLHEEARANKTESVLPENNEEDEDGDEVEAGKAAGQPELSIALVKIMIENGNYRKALEIITDINLKNPKKSIYFADQIRFLHKLIQIQEKSNEQKN